MCCCARFFSYCQNLFAFAPNVNREKNVSIDVNVVEKTNSRFVILRLRAERNSNLTIKPK